MFQRIHKESKEDCNQECKEEFKSNTDNTPKKSPSSISSLGTPKSKKTTLELRAQSAHSLMHLPSQDSKFKILIVGNANCGKTSIIERFVSNKFSEEYQTTVGADFRKKILNWTELGDAKVAKKVKLHVFDIAGQDRFARLTRSYFNAANGALVVCDVTREGTFEAAGEWKRELDRALTTIDENGRPIKVPVVLVANKCDLLQDVASSFVAGAKMEQACRQHGFVGWFVTSAKSGSNVTSCMSFLTRQMLAARDLQRAKFQQKHLQTAQDTGFGNENGNGIVKADKMKATHDITEMFGSTRAYYDVEEDLAVMNPYQSAVVSKGLRLKDTRNQGRRGSKAGRQQSSGCC